MEQSVHQGLIALTCARMHYETGRLVDHDQIVIVINHVERNRLWLDVDLFQRRRVQNNPISGANERVRGNLCATSMAFLCNLGRSPTRPVTWAQNFGRTISAIPAAIITSTAER